MCAQRGVLPVRTVAPSRWPALLFLFGRLASLLCLGTRLSSNLPRLTIARVVQAVADDGC